jgi:hypothetical protein
MGSRWFNKAVSIYLKTRRSRLENIKNNPYFHQERILMKLLNTHKNSEVGQEYNFNKIRNCQAYRENLPIRKYEDIKPYVDRMMRGERDVLVKGSVEWYAKSSGTTSSRSKYIPVTNDFFYGNLMRSSWDTTSIVYQYRPDAEVFQKKSLIMGGSLAQWPENEDVTIGDVSAIMISRIPAIGRPFYTPDQQIATLPDWEEKIEKMAEAVIKEDVVLFGGVPTWTLVLFEYILQITGCQKMVDVWPNVKTYLHGGVGFSPYRKQFDAILGTNDFDYYEVYNASEGYFAIQDRQNAGDMLLLLDNGIYYEFIPSEEWESEEPRAISLEEVEEGQHYAIVITNAAGLWRYTPGDTVLFTSVKPYRIQVSGRTQHFINVFGEEVMVGNTDKAVAMTCSEHPAIIKEYTVGPIHLERNKKGGHLWLIEFDENPKSLFQFEKLLDRNLRKINSDYDAKRFKDIALQALKIEVVPKGTFHKWLRSKGKIGGQHKVPRLSNSRELVEELLVFVR